MPRPPSPSRPLLAEAPEAAEAAVQSGGEPDGSDAACESQTQLTTGPSRRLPRPKAKGSAVANDMHDLARECEKRLTGPLKISHEDWKDVLEDTLNAARSVEPVEAESVEAGAIDAAESVEAGAIDAAFAGYVPHQNAVVIFPDPSAAPSTAPEVAPVATAPARMSATDLVRWVCRERPKQWNQH